MVGVALRIATGIVGLFVVQLFIRFEWALSLAAPGETIRVTWLPFMTP